VSNRFSIFPEHLFRGAELFALRVKGASMEDAGILGGDIAVLDAAAEVESGAIAAVLIGDEATLKYVHREDGGLLLRAANTAFPDLKLDSATSEQARMMGRLVGVVRSV
jgi:repressor LexA